MCGDTIAKGACHFLGCTALGTPQIHAQYHRRTRHIQVMRVKPRFYTISTSMPTRPVPNGANTIRKPIGQPIRIQPQRNSARCPAEGEYLLHEILESSSSCSLIVLPHFSLQLQKIMTWWSPLLQTGYILFLLARLSL